MISYKRDIIATLCIALYLISHASALYANNNDNEDALIKHDLSELVDYDLSTTSRLPTSIINSPGLVTVFDNRDITRLGVESLLELLNYVPGMMQISSGNGNITGIVSRSDFNSFSSSNTLLLINGRKVNNYAYSSWTIPHSLMSLHNVERVEVMHGPGSAIYGENAVSAVINVIANEHDNSITLGAGSFNEYKIGLNATKDLPLGAFNFNFFYTQNNGQEYNNIQTVDKPWDIKDSAKDGIIDATRDPSKRTELDLMFSNEDVEMSYSYSEQHARGFYSPSMFLDDDIVSNLAQQHRWHARWNFNIVDYIDSSLIYSGQHDSRIVDEPFVDREKIYPFYAFGPQGYAPTQYPKEDMLVAAILEKYPDGFPVDSITRQATEDIQQKIAFENDLSFKQKHNLSFGFGIEKNTLLKDEIKSNYNLETLELIDGFYNIKGLENSLFLKNANKEVNWYAYTEFKFELYKDIDSHIGIRLDKMEDLRARVSPRLALIWEYDNHRALKLVYSEAFKRHRPSLIFNPNYTFIDKPPKPIEFTSLEMIHEYETSIFRHQMSLYYRRVENITSRKDISYLINYIDQSDHQASGIEMNLNILLPHDITLRTTASYQLEADEYTLNNNSDADGAINPSRFIASMAINKAMGKWNFNLNGFHNSSSRHREGFVALDEREHPSLNWFNFATNYQYNKDINLSFRVKNLLNYEYNIFEKNFQNNHDFVPMRGRSYHFNLNYQF